MRHFEIERKWILKEENLPKDLKKYRNEHIEQGYIFKNPSIRIRKYGKKYFLNIKTSIGKDLLVRNEYETEISKKSYNELLKKVESNIIKKRRYLFPYKKYIIEIDCFEGDFKGLFYAEVEFNSVKEAREFKAPDWFSKEVTDKKNYDNQHLAFKKL